MSNNTYDWTTFTKQIFIQAPVEDVFRAWVTPEGLKEWFIAEADYVRPDGDRRAGDETVQSGDSYQWRWHQGNQIGGEVLDVQPDRLFQFTFGEREPGSAEKIVVTVTFDVDEGGGTRLELCQHNMADNPAAHVQWHMSCNLGWSFFMTNLKALLEHGVDLRETDRERAAASRAISH